MATEAAVKTFHNTLRKELRESVRTPVVIGAGFGALWVILNLRSIDPLFGYTTLDLATFGLMVAFFSFAAAIGLLRGWPWTAIFSAFACVLVAQPWLIVHPAPSLSIRVQNRTPIFANVFVSMANNPNFRILLSLMPGEEIVYKTAPCIRR